MELRRENVTQERVSDHDLISKPRNPQRVKASTHVTVSREFIKAATGLRRSLCSVWMQMSYKLYILYIQIDSQENFILGNLISANDKIVSVLLLLSLYRRIIKVPVDTCCEKRKKKKNPKII